MRNILFFFSVWVEERERELGLRRAQRKERKKEMVGEIVNENKNKNQNQNGLRKTAQTKEKQNQSERETLLPSFLSDPSKIFLFFFNYLFSFLLIIIYSN